MASRRRDAIDVARVLALLVVVFGHLSLAVIDRHDGAVRGANLVALHPGWAFVTVLAPMPVFFAAAGWAHTTSTLASATPRLRSLVGLGAVVVAAWSAAVVVAVLATGHAGVMGDGARIATQPLWFVAAYVPLAALGGRIARLSSDHVILALGIALGGLAAMDTARFLLGAPDWVGWPGFYLAWGTPWVLGAWWRSRHERGAFEEQRVGIALALVAGIGCAALVAWCGYSAALIDVVAGERSNTTPPTLYTAVAAVAQVGALLVIARALDGWGHRWRRLWDRAGEAAVGVYAWHLSALALCAAVIAAGLPVPDRLTVPWWLTRPIWWAAVLGVTAGLVVLTGSVRAELARRRPAGFETSPRRAAIGVIVAAAAGVAVGLRGPRTPTWAIVCTALFVSAWLLLRSRRSDVRGDHVRERLAGVVVES